MTKRIMPLFMVFLSFAFVQAQGECHYTLKGKVMEAKTNAPLPFASVLVHELAIGAVTDENGNFIIKNLCRQSYTLDFTHVECQKHSEIVVIDGNTEGVFHLQHEDKILQNVVVTGKKVALENTPSANNFDGW